MASLLPPIPRFVFTIFEPLSLVAGCLAPFVDTSGFVAAQVPAANPTWTPATLTPAHRVLALQLGNMYGLMAMVGVGVLYATTEPKVVRNFLIACAVADVGHMYATYAVMGYERFVDVGGWNNMAWGNIGVTAGLLITRVLYLLGALGKDRVVESTRDAVKKGI